MFLFPILYAFVVGSVVLFVFTNNPNPPTYSAHQYLNHDLIPVPPAELARLKKAQVPTLTQQKCFENRYCNCPSVGGSYEQCTNNYKHEPSQGQCKCDSGTFELCPWPFKISEKKYKPKKVRFDNIPPPLPHQPLDPLFMNTPAVVYQ